MKFLKRYIKQITLIISAVILAGVVFTFTNHKSDTEISADIHTSTPQAMETATPTPCATSTHTKTDPPATESVVFTLKPEKVTAATTAPITETQPAEKDLTCTLSVRCDTILNNMSLLDSSKAEILPKDGIVLSKRTVTFYDGESVFNLLSRELKRNKIHFEFHTAPVYNSAYIEGIANLYEFDCGELSGWMYKVNGYFPNYGCSRYILKQGDDVEWVYTCDLGKDVGGEYSARNGNTDANE